MKQAQKSRTGVQLEFKAHQRGLRLFEQKVAVVLSENTLDGGRHEPFMILGGHHYRHQWGVSGHAVLLSQCIVATSPPAERQPHPECYGHQK